MAQPRIKLTFWKALKNWLFSQVSMLRGQFSPDGFVPSFFDWQSMLVLAFGYGLFCIISKFC